MKHCKSFIFAILFMVVLAGIVYGEEGKIINSDEALASLQISYPQVQAFRLGNYITRLYGTQFSFGNSPEDAALNFKDRYSAIFGVNSEDLLPVSFLGENQNILGLMYDRNTGLYKFTLVIYSQYRDGIPVFRSDLRLLVRNEIDYPLVGVTNSLKDLGGFRPDLSQASIDPVLVQNSFLASQQQMNFYDKPQMVIWAGHDTAAAEPALGVAFMAWDATPPTEKNLYIVDPTTLSIIYQENQLIDIDITGQVNGMATEVWYSEQCGNEIERHLPYAKVTRGRTVSTFADSTGYFVLPNEGDTAVTIGSKIAGRYFITRNSGGSDDSLGQRVTPPGPVTFLHNPSNTEQKRAEVNGYIQANVVRDFLLKYHPTYPTIYSQLNFPVYVNRNDGYCPGNAWYDGSSINFCRSGSGYPNTAFSTVVHHEYGHHIVACGGSGQGQYGEGLGDVMGVLITDTSGVAYGFYGGCSSPLRNADNNIQYPCSGEIHDCGQLISGCVWATREALIVTNPGTYRDIISALAINSVPLHGSSDLIAPDITIDFLNLDDDNGNLADGTPHAAEICTGFNAHNMDCPVMQLLRFNYPEGHPNCISPNGGTMVRVEVIGNAQPNTGVLHYKTGTQWLTVNMTEIAPNIYEAIFPAVTCGTSVDFYFSAQMSSGTIVNDPVNAPASSYSTISATSIEVLFSDDFSSDLGWTGMDGPGEWARGTAVGGTGSDTYGKPDPSFDHSPSIINNVLGNDLSSGTGGDYAANLATTYWITSPVIDCSGKSNIKLSFYRWLGVQRNTYDHAYFAVTDTAGNWINLFSNSSSNINDSSWSKNSYDVSVYADNNPNFQMKFGIGSTNASQQYCGWNIDDILVTTAVACDTTDYGTIAGAVNDSLGNVTLCRAHAFDNLGHNGYAMSGPDGTYSFNIPPGTYSVTYSQIDHRDTTMADVVVSSNNTTTVNVTLLRLKGAVKGTVIGMLSTPVANARVIIPQVGLEDSTGEDGRFLFENLVDGAYSLSFSNIDYYDTTVTNVSITPGDTSVLNVVMKPVPGWINGTILDTSGVAVESVFVRLNDLATLIASAKAGADPSHGDPIILAVDSTYTNAAGYYSMHPPSGIYSAMFSHPNYRDTSIANVTVTPNDTVNVSPRIKPVNHAPDITSPAADTATEHQAYSYLATATDIDGHNTTIAFSNFPNWLTVHGDTISGTPQENNNGSTTFRIIASDGELRDTLIVALTVLEVNDPPIITSPDSASAVYNNLFTYRASAFDPEGAQMVFTFRDYPTWLIPDSNFISGTPPVGIPDTSFIVMVSDGQLDDTLLVSLSVQSACNYIAGDINGNGSSNGLDVVYAVGYFRGGPIPPIDCGGICPEPIPFYAAMDVNGNCITNGIDITYYVRFLKGEAAELFFCPDCPPVHIAPVVPAFEPIRPPAVIAKPVTKIQGAE